jgi:hypothetical protein
MERDTEAGLVDLPVAPEASGVKSITVHPPGVPDDRL